MILALYEVGTIVEVRFPDQPQLYYGNVQESHLMEDQTLYIVEFLPGIATQVTEKQISIPHLIKQ